ncbi:PepSY domain-containing protein [Sphingomonas sp. Leaf17]|uniref:PepSY domain-containing protein n=1 Tax=Sphingomonas sp. Leaf17 TaxID=1735683 RepID=UPI000A62A2E3|nr:PepSY domain-containing protein [Sphingomonas sp. Leaf17]
MKILLAALAIVAVATPALADNDTPTRAQRAAVMKTLRAAGCTSPSNIERDDGGYEVDNARCKDGVYDITLSADLRMVSREKDTND